MLAFRNSVSAVTPPLSFGTFIKHLPTLVPAALSPNRISYRTLTTAAVHSSTHFQTLTSCQKEQIHLYVDALLDWNQKMNLTAVTEVSEVMERHIEDSLSIIPPIRRSYLSHCGGSYHELSLVDVGTGAGLPGLILAIACPGWKVTLLESINKRCVFLEHAVSLTGLSNVQVIRERAEFLGLNILLTFPDYGAYSEPCYRQNLGQNLGFREVFDVAVARAVAEMRVLAEYCLPLVRVGGLFVAAKGHDPLVCIHYPCLELILCEEVRRAETAIRLMGASILEMCSGISSRV
ncbi:hypothetical protein RHSIM_Rhsim12G0161700 [Rhododendron simsii]|uniref:Ribosomal RNA small subunit methyltransferase G n=1 Tax=Rhododendron simsii TaxID=118357 RepID=A0A834G5Z4_RHOSS|nr:hypothetical protein RHSIM_Rhsim12G0161700 [Rhododendron simsii]